MAKFCIGDRVFRSKKAATEVVQSVLHKYELGATLNVEDSGFIWDLLHLSRKAKEKKGCGIDHFEVRKDEWPTQGRRPGEDCTRCFWVVRNDGTSVSFSLHRCINPDTPEQRVKAAFRLVVADDIVRFKKQAFVSVDGETSCALTGQSVVYRDCDADHVVPFNKLVKDFCVGRGLVLAEIRVQSCKKLGRRGYGLCFEDERLAAAWRGYHQRHMKLRVVGREAHSHLSRKIPCP